MSLETMSFILGGILVASALFGGGIEIKELKLPQIGTIGRIMTAIFGVGFIALAINLNSKVVNVEPKSADSNPTKTTVTFPKPMQGDLRLDVCQSWSKDCGEAAATAWCKTKGFSRAAEFLQENVGKEGIATRLIGENKVCTEKFCTSFAYITCEK
jgi:hypothetical protein